MRRRSKLTLQILMRVSLYQWKMHTVAPVARLPTLPSTSQNYQQSPLILKRNLECSEGTPNHGQELPFSVGDVSFESFQNLDNDDLLQEILGEIAEGTPQHKSKIRKINH